MTFIADIVNHGTYSGYTNNGCRCEPCRGAMRSYVKARKERGISWEQHGTYTGYNFYSCRCMECRGAYDKHRERKRDEAAGFGVEHGVHRTAVTLQCPCAECKAFVRERNLKARQRKLKGTGMTVAARNERHEVRWDGVLIGWATVGPGGFTTYDADGALIDWNPVLRYEFADKIVNHAREKGELHD